MILPSALRISPRIALGLVVSTLAAGPLPGKLAPPSDERIGSARAPATTLAVPPIEAAAGAFLAAREWVDSLAVPPADDPASRPDLPGCRGVAVSLRHEGRLVGFGEEFLGDAEFADPDGLVLRRAVAKALARARGDRVVSSLPEDLRGSIGTRLTLEIEFAGAASPLLGRTFAECGDRIEPGIDGLAIRRGTACFAAFPGRLLATGLAGTPGRTLLSLAGEAGFPPKDLSELVRIEPVGVYRFRSVRLGQADPEGLPVELLRSGRLVDAVEVDRDGLAAFVSALLARVQRTLPDPSGGDPETILAKGLALGDYLPVPDEYRPLVAGPLDQALLAFSLADIAANPGIANSDRDRARRLASGLLEAIGRMPRQPDDPVAVANVAPLLVLATSRLGELAEGPGKDVSARAVTACVAPDASGDPALLAAAVTAMASRGLVELAIAEAAVARAWSAAPGDRQVGAFPWLVLAEETLARTASRPPGRVAELQSLAALVLAAQVDAKDLSVPMDLAGGIRLGGPRTPITAQSFRPLLGLAWLDSRAVPAGLPLAESVAARVAAGNRAGGRYLMQLAVDENASRLFRNPPRARGGIRAAAWEGDQPVSVQAFGLLLASALLSPDGLADR